MTPTVRTWLAFAAVGAGLIHLALALGAPPALAAVLAIVGGAEFLFGLATIAAGRLPAPRAVLVGALTPTVLWILGVLALDNEPALRVLPLAISSLLEFFSAAAIAVFLRRERDSTTQRSASAGRQPLRRIIAGGLVIAALTLGALAATSAADFVAPEGSFTDEHEPH